MQRTETGRRGGADELQSHCDRCCIVHCKTSPLGGRDIVAQPIDIYPSVSVHFLETIGSCKLQFAETAEELQFLLYNLLIALHLTIPAMKLLDVIRQGRTITHEDLAPIKREVIVQFVDNPVDSPLAQLYTNGHHQETESIASEADDQEIEAKRQQLYELLSNREVFPWITEVTLVEDNPTELLVVIDQTTAFAHYINAIKLSITTLRSWEEVSAFIRANTGSQKTHAALSQVIERGVWPIVLDNSLEDNLHIEEIYAQLVSLMLFKEGIANQSGHWQKLFGKLDNTVVSGFKSNRHVFVRHSQLFMPQATKNHIVDRRHKRTKRTA